MEAEKLDTNIYLNKRPSDLDTKQPYFMNAKKNTESYSTHGFTFVAEIILSQRRRKQTEE